MTFFKLIEGFMNAATAPGGQLPMSRQKIGGVTYTAFDTIPASLRDLFLMLPLHGDLPFVVEGEQTSSFADIYAQSVQCAHGLVGQGVQKGDRVAIFMRNRTQWIISFIGAAMAGAVVTPLNSWWGPRELSYALSDSGARVLLADPKRAKHANALADLSPDLIKIICCAKGQSEFADWVHFENLLAHGGPVEPPMIDIKPEDNAALMYTSGTTGYPKGALSTHRAILSGMFGYAMMGMAMQFYRNGGKMDDVPGPQLSVLLPIPLFHVTGCVVAFLVSVLAGRKLVLMRKWDVQEAMALIEREKIISFTGVPTMTADLMNAPNREQYDLSSLRDLSAGGAARPADQVQKLEDAFANGAPLAGYGLTETNGIGAFIGGDAYLANPASIGKPLCPLVEMEIRDPDTGDVLPGGVRGEIYIKSVCNIKEYWNQAAATKEVFDQNWLKTGDVGYFDENGLLFIVDRIKDIIIRGGENIATLAVENAISALDDVLECAVFGLPHDRLGEEVAAVICLKPGAVLSTEDIQCALSGTLAAYKIPSKIVVGFDRLARIATGKIAKRDLRKGLLC